MIPWFSYECLFKVFSNNLNIKFLQHEHSLYIYSYYYLPYVVINASRIIGNSTIERIQLWNKREYGLVHHVTKTHLKRNKISRQLEKTYFQGISGIKNQWNKKHLSFLVFQKYPNIEDVTIYRSDWKSDWIFTFAFIFDRQS